MLVINVDLLSPATATGPSDILLQTFGKVVNASSAAWDVQQLAKA